MRGSFRFRYMSWCHGPKIYWVNNCVLYIYVYCSLGWSYPFQIPFGIILHQSLKPHTSRCDLMLMGPSWISLPLPFVLPSFQSRTYLAMQGNHPEQVSSIHVWTFVLAVLPLWKSSWGSCICKTSKMSGPQRASIIVARACDWHKPSKLLNMMSFSYVFLNSGLSYPHSQYYFITCW